MPEHMHVFGALAIPTYACNRHVGLTARPEMCSSNIKDGIGALHSVDKMARGMRYN